MKKRLLAMLLTCAIVLGLSASADFTDVQTELTYDNSSETLPNTTDEITTDEITTGEETTTEVETGETTTTVTTAATTIAAITTTTVATTTATTTTRKPKRCKGCGDYDCENQPVRLGYILGDENWGELYKEDGKVPKRRIRIGDLLEVMRYMMGMTSVLDKCPRAFKASLITGDKEPTICDIYQFVWYMNRFPNSIEKGGAPCASHMYNITHRNHPDQVDIFEALFLLKYLGGMPPKFSFPCFYKTQWVKGGNEPTIFDVLEILKYVIGANSRVETVIDNEMSELLDDFFNF